MDLLLNKLHDKNLLTDELKKVIREHFEEIEEEDKWVQNKMRTELKFIPELYTTKELERLKDHYELFKIYRSNLTRDMLDNMRFNSLLEELQKLIQLECPKCECSNDLRDFVDQYENFYQNNVCYECNKVEGDVVEYIDKYFEELYALEVQE